MTPALRVDRVVIDAPGLPDDDAHALAWLIAEHLGRLGRVPGGTWPDATITRAPGEGPDQLARRIAEHLARRLFEEAGR